MSPVRAITLLISTAITIPIWYYLLYQILVRVGASELMMFLFWVYLPVHIIGILVMKMGEIE